MIFKSFLIFLLASLGVRATSENGKWYHFDKYDVSLKDVLKRSFQGVKSHLLVRGCSELSVHEVETSGRPKIIHGATYKTKVSYRSSCPSKFPFAPPKVQTCIVNVVATKIFEEYNIYEMEIRKCEKPKFEKLPSFDGTNPDDRKAPNSIMGVIKRTGLASHYMKNISEFGLKHLEGKAKSPVELKFIKISDATLQIEGGYVERLLVTFSVKNKQVPPEKSNPEVRATCYFQVLNQFVKFLLQDYDCDIDMFMN